MVNCKDYSLIVKNIMYFDLIIGFLLCLLGCIIIILRYYKMRSGFIGSIQAKIIIFGVGVALMISGIFIHLKAYSLDRFCSFTPF